MKNVFVSRPTWVSPEFEAGLTSFLNFLETHELKPRTLGAGDYANKTPLDEVISIMGECAGAIILGYPQIQIEKGFCKTTAIPTSGPVFLLPTEWNHIEASLAHARGLPLLLIHHIGVRRGVFDRGAIPHFLYERDLSDPSWPLQPDISGAFSKWKMHLQTPPSTAPTNKSLPENPFINAQGVLWHRTSSGVEDIAYCPTCRLAMSVFPPGSDEMVACSKCNYIAPFRPSQLKEKVTSALRTLQPKLAVLQSDPCPSCGSDKFKVIRSRGVNQRTYYCDDCEYKEVRDIKHK